MATAQVMAPSEQMFTLPIRSNKIDHEEHSEDHTVDSIPSKPKDAESSEDEDPEVTITIYEHPDATTIAQDNMTSAESAFSEVHAELDNTIEQPHPHDIDEEEYTPYPSTIWGQELEFKHHLGSFSKRFHRLQHIFCSDDAPQVPAHNTVERGDLRQLRKIGEVVGSGEVLERAREMLDREAREHVVHRDDGFCCEARHRNVKWKVQLGFWWPESEEEEENEGE